MSKRITLNIPKKLNDDQAIGFNNELKSVEEADEYVFDFSELEFAEPFGMLFLGQSIREFHLKGNKQALIPQDEKSKWKPCSYLAHMGFFKDVGISHGKTPGQASGGHRYMPITQINFEELANKSKYQKTHTLLEEEAARLAGILYQNKDEENHKILSYIIFESLRNAMEHSGAEQVRIVGQYWDSGRAEIAILDAGMGVLESLREKPDYQSLDNDVAAIKKAILPAVSSKLIRNGPSHNDYENSGFGLYMLKKICSDAGSLLISSNCAALEIKDGGENSLSHQGLKGTSLKVELDLDKLKALGTLEENLCRYRDASNVLAKPSVSSMGFMHRKN